jgi:hypothetical protein
MPTGILKKSELDLIINKCPEQELIKMVGSDYQKGFSKDKMKAVPFKQKIGIFSAIDENLRKCLPLRDTDRIAMARNAYSRRGTA